MVSWVSSEGRERTVAGIVIVYRLVMRPVVLVDAVCHSNDKVATFGRVERITFRPVTIGRNRHLPQFFPLFSHLSMPQTQRGPYHYGGGCRDLSNGRLFAAETPCYNPLKSNGISGRNR